MGYSLWLRAIFCHLDCLECFLVEFSDLENFAFPSLEMLEALKFDGRKIRAHDAPLAGHGDDSSLNYFVLVLTEVVREIADNYGSAFHYNSYNPLLIGIILERATGMTVSD